MVRCSTIVEEAGNLRSRCAEVWVFKVMTSMLLSFKNVECLTHISVFDLGTAVSMRREWNGEISG